MFLNQVHFIRGELQRARGWRLAIILGGPLVVLAVLAVLTVVAVLAVLGQP